MLTYLHLWSGEVRRALRTDCPPDGVCQLFTARAGHKQTTNEDAALVAGTTDAGTVLAVADGVGGLPDGDKAARLSLDTLGEALAAGSDGTLREAVLAGFEEANRRVLTTGSGGAATLIVATIVAGELRCYWVGDSGILVLSARGNVRLQNTAHSPVAYALESGWLDEREAMLHAERHLVSNVIGTEGMHVSISSPVRLGRQDTVVLASDGLFDNLYTAEIVAGLRRGRLARSVDEVVALCQRRMAAPLPGEPSKSDDLTILAWRYAQRRLGRNCGAPAPVAAGTE